MKSCGKFTIFTILLGLTQDIASALKANRNLSLVLPATYLENRVVVSYSLVALLRMIKCCS